MNAGTGRPGLEPGLTRRGFLARTARTATAGTAAALAAGGLGGFLAGCDATAIHANMLSLPPPPGPSNPILWPIMAGNRPIADGRRAERDATLTIYTWSRRIAAACLHKFMRKYGCRVRITTFDSMNEAMTTMTTMPTRFDLFLGVPVGMLVTLIKGGLIQPVNHSYIPNISQVWQQLADPFYDQNWQYTVPYTTYTTGIGWRRDLVDADPYAMVNGWTVLWQPKHKGRVGILDDYREAISLGLLAGDMTNLNTSDPRQIDDAAASLTKLGDLAKPRLENNAFSQLATGSTWIQHAWSGQVAAAARNLPPGTPRDVLGYWFPPNGQGPVANDTITIPRGARNPVLAHLFMNFMLDAPNAFANARGTGYMQPLNLMTPNRLVRHGVLPPSLISTAVLANDFDRGLPELQLSPAADALWQQAWQSVVTHMRLAESI